MTIPNVHPVTGIHYGVINANNIHHEVLDAISFGHAIDISYLESRVEFAKQCGFVMPEKEENESPYAFAKRVQDLLDSSTLESDESDSDDSDEDQDYQESEDFTGNIWYGDYEGIQTIYDTDTNIVTVLHSPVIVMANQCSPCYPNAGDLDTLNEDGIETYGIPEWWKPEV